MPCTTDDPTAAMAGSATHKVRVNKTNFTPIVFKRPLWAEGSNERFCWYIAFLPELCCSYPISLFLYQPSPRAELRRLRDEVLRVAVSVARFICWEWRAQTNLRMPARSEFPAR